MQFFIVLLLLFIAFSYFYEESPEIIKLPEQDSKISNGDFS